MIKVTITREDGEPPVTREEALALAKLAIAKERGLILTEAQASIASMSLALDRGLCLPPVRDDTYPAPNPLNESGGSK